GDVDGSWEQFAEQIPAGLNFTMTGLPYWTTDIGGFFRGKPGKNRDYLDQYTNPKYRELLTRWFQYGTFTPLFRIHGFKTETEIWNFGQEFENIARKFIDIRYQLMPYIYSEAWEVTKNGKLLMSPLTYYFPEDKNTWNIQDQFMFGQSLMICPVITYQARERSLYLPEGNWYDFQTSEKIEGGKQIIAPAPLNSIPMYVKEGTILPWGPKLQHVDEETDEPVTLRIYPGKDASYTLYYDDYKSYGYEKGEYSELIVSYSEKDHQVTLKKGNDRLLNFQKNPQKFTIEVIGKGLKHSLVFEGETIEKILH
ncbi:MAG: TIM-barrel domain-containing protein, partial [Bacteroidota bacterium]